MKQKMKILITMAVLALSTQLAQAGGTHIPNGISHPVCRFGENSRVLTFTQHSVLQQVQSVRIPNSGQDGQFLADLIARGILEANVVSDELRISFANSLSQSEAVWAHNQKVGTKIESQIIANDHIRLTFSRIAFAVRGECIREQIVEFIPGQPVSICAEYAVLEPQKTLDQEVVDVELNNCTTQ